MIKTFQAIDKKHATPKIRYFRAEYKYAIPPHIGNARNSLVFGRIPKHQMQQEKRENFAALQAHYNQVVKRAR